MGMIRPVNYDVGCLFMRQQDNTYHMRMFTDQFWASKQEGVAIQKGVEWRAPLCPSKSMGDTSQLINGCILMRLSLAKNTQQQ